MGLAGLAACGDDDGGGGDGGGAAVTSSTTSGETAPEPLAVGDLEAPEAGAVRLALGADLDITMDVAVCTLDLDAQPDGQVPATLVSIEAAGATDAGVPVAVDVKRFRSAGAATTITDTITVLEGTEEVPVRVLVAQRFEVGGLVTDGRDPDARDPLLRITQGTVVARGVFAPPGAFAGEPGAVEGALTATCD